ncbi:hypothetical protein [Sphaerisporangium corydalis]|uniref:Uncharacterized protein n=1 Tax=Sphaerisporangium corydalis TaxID=1441875 RepID=A0ABV9E747_9ACTN|nr:hypothetical protein [Sphaerisporangium corydalis]
MRWHSYRARWRGADYEASAEPRADGLWMRLRVTAPAEGFDEVAPGRHVRPVRAEECEAVLFVTMTGRWRGAECQVHDEREGELLVEYTGGRLPVARELGLERVERGVHRAWVPRHEVVDLREHAVPL